MAHKRLALLAPVPLLKTKNYRVKVSVVVDRVKRDVTVLGVVHPLEKDKLTLAYSQGIQNLLHAGKRPVLAEGFLADTHAHSTRIYFTRSDSWYSWLDQSADYSSNQTQRLHSFSKKSDVKKNILDESEIRETSLTEIIHFPNGTKHSTKDVLASISMALECLDHFRTNPKDNKLKFICGLNHQQQLGHLLQSPALFYEKITAFLSHVGTPYTPQSPSPATSTELLGWIDNHPHIFLNPIPLQAQDAV